MDPGTRKGVSIAAACVLGMASAAWAANPGPTRDARETYLADRAFCKSGAAWQDERTCLREAGAALEEARHGKLKDPEANFEQNRLARCAVHEDPTERGYCERRMRGEGTTSGSVEGGGVLRELVVTVPGS